VSRKRHLSFLILALIGVALAAGTVLLRKHYERLVISQATTIVQAPNAAPENAAQDITSDTVLKSGQRFPDLLEDLEFDPAVAAQIADAASQVFDFRKLRAGNRMRVVRSAAGAMKSLTYQVDRDTELEIEPAATGFHAELKTVPSEIKTVAVTGQINGSLFDSVIAAGETPELAVRMAEIFAWDIDFYTDPRPGDSFRLLVEKKEYKNGQPPTYDRILVAEYDNAGHPYRAGLFHDSRGVSAYYSADGQSLQKAFLRSPLKFAARVSSHFSRNRFHPILKIYRPHLGTDYAAPTGTPVQAIGSGTVAISAYKGGGGNTVEIRHTQGFESYYMHLSRRLVRSGQRVQQGQRIGLVGMTGLATGPHLDFRLKKRGSFVDFEHMKLPPANPVQKKDRREFLAQRDTWMKMLDEDSKQELASQGPGSNQPQAVAGQQ
jgi:murein DD-endopeptidase MepM/ murein hydrolase activator NlpD